MPKGSKKLEMKMLRHEKEELPEQPVPADLPTMGRLAGTG